MTTTVSVPGSDKATTPLGVGMATLMREPSTRKQLRVLEAAYDVGYRYIDTAPSYGLGAAETVLGQFLRGRRDEVTVATKFGREVSVSSPLMRFIQRPARALLKRFPSLRGAATQAAGRPLHQPVDFSPEAADRSLERSLRALGTDYVDILLLHDVRPEAVADDPLGEWVDRQIGRGRIRAVGLATSPHATVEILRAHPGRYAVLQMASHVLAPAGDLVDPLRPPLRVTHSALAPVLARFREQTRADARWARRLDSLAGADATSSVAATARFLLAWALHECAGGVVLVGSTSPDHLRSAADTGRTYEPDALDRARVFVAETVEGRRG